MPNKSSIIIFFSLLIFYTINVKGQGTNTVVSEGSYIINMGVEPQTVNNGLKPFGLLQALFENDIPVIWSIAEDKNLGDTDFVYDNVDYKSGAFIVESHYIDTNIEQIITDWEAEGVVGVYTNQLVTIPYYKQVLSFPSITIDSRSIGTPSGYFENAGILFSSNVYSIGAASDLDACSEVFVAVDIDMDFANEGPLYEFIINQNGYVFAQGKSASTLESIVDPGNGTKKYHFLGTLGLECYDVGECNATAAHPSNYQSPIAYDQTLASDPNMQFLGDPASATDSGDEAWYTPVFTWNNNVNFAITTADGTGNSIGVKLAYGRAFDFANYGKLMYMAGDDFASAENPENIAAQRIFFNFLLTTSIDRNEQINISGADVVVEGQASIFNPEGQGGYTPTNTTWFSACGGSLGTDVNELSFEATADNLRYTCELFAISTDDCNKKALSQKTITVYPENQNPNAVNDADILTVGDEPLVIDVLDNDSDSQPDDQLTVTEIVESPTNGIAVIEDNKIKYTGNNDEYINDSFTYKVCDDGLPSLCSQATVTITNELQINTAPIVEDQSFEVIAGDQLNICITGTDNENDDLIVSSINYLGTTAQVANGANDDLCFSYTIDENFSGLEQVEVTVCDVRANSLCTDALITINVTLNNPPTIEDQEFTIASGKPTEFCIRAIDLDSDEIYLSSLVYGNENALVDNNSDDDLCFNYQSNSDFSGEDEITVIVCDLNAAYPRCTEKVITVNVTANQPPIVEPQSFAVQQGEPAEICIEATDDDGVTLTELIYNNTVATVGLGSTTDLCFNYNPSSNYIGQDEVIVRVCDLNEFSQSCTERLITITVTANSPPIIEDQNFTVMQGEPAEFCVIATDNDGVSLTALDYSNTVANVDVGSTTDLCFNYQSGIDFSGQDEVIVTVCDMNEFTQLCTEKTIIINVVVNSPPIFENQTFLVESGENVELCLEATDLDRTPLVISAIDYENNIATVSADFNDLCLDYQSENNYDGEDEIYVTVCEQNEFNAKCAEALIKIIVKDSTPAVLVSKAITPDGNGQNDVFILTNIETYPNNQVKIFDRWGSTIFETSGYNNDSNYWDGYNGGRDSPSGTYFYLVELNETGESFKGFVELVK